MSDTGSTEVPDQSLETDRVPVLSRMERRSRRQIPAPTPGRIAAVAAVAAVIVVVAAIDLIASNPVPPAAPPQQGAMAIASSDAQSNSWFCAGSGAGPTAMAGSTIYLANTTTQAIHGVMSVTVTGASGSRDLAKRSVVVPSHGITAVDPATGAPAGSVATSFTFAQGGVGVTQVLAGGSGWTTSPCASATAPQWYLAGGSTTSGATQTLSLFNPTATDAVVNVSFLTNSGVIEPQAYQGLVIPAGQLVVENVGDFVQNQPEIATDVQAESGQIVAFQLQRWQLGTGGGMGLTLGAPQPAAQWLFAQSTNATGATVVLHLVNPGPNPVEATVKVLASTVSVEPAVVQVPALGVVAFVASNQPSFPKGVPYAVTVTASGGTLVVARTVQSSLQAPSPQWGSSMGTSAPEPNWLMTSPGIPAAPGIAGASINSLAVANPGNVAARVTVSALVGGKVVTTLVVQPHAVAVLSGRAITGLTPMMVRSNQPVALEEDSGPAGSPGVVSSIGLPLAS